MLKSHLFMPQWVLYVYEYIVMQVLKKFVCVGGVFIDI